MLGEQIAEFKGKAISQSVLDTEGPFMETSVSFTGKVRGIPAKETVTFDWSNGTLLLILILLLVQSRNNPG